MEGLVEAIKEMLNLQRQQAKHLRTLAVAFAALQEQMGCREAEEEDGTRELTPDRFFSACRECPYRPRSPS